MRCRNPAIRPRHAGPSGYHDEVFHDDEHLVRVDDWGRCVWGAWAEHHATVRRWLDATLMPA